MPILTGGEPDTFSMTVPMDWPLYGGVAPPVAPPMFPYSVSIAGRNYLIDTSFEPYRREAFRQRTIQAQKANITVNNEPGEGTVDTQSLWRRLAEDWALGSGQLWFDRRDSVANRFRQSKGINCWTQWAITLLNDTFCILVSDNPVIIPCQAGNYLYVLDGNIVRFTSNAVTWATITDLPGDVTDITTNGYDVWVASPSAGLFHSVAGASSFDTYMATGPMTYVGFTGDRLMSSYGPKVFNILNTVTPVLGTLTTGLTGGAAITTLALTSTAYDVSVGDNIVVWDGVNNQTFIASAAVASGNTSVSVVSEVANFSYPIGSDVGGVTPLWTHPNSQWIWPDFQYGSTEIYIAGYPNSVPIGNGAVYRTSIDSNGIDLIVPVIALPLEGGEYPVKLGGYLNLVMVGTNLGMRVCETLALYDPTGNAGDLKSGPLLPSTIEPVTKPVTGICANGRFLYFTWDKYDDESSGIARCDLSRFIDQLAPAYASDLMVDNAGELNGNMTLDWCTITDSPVMGVPGLGLFTSEPSGALVDSGTIDSGLISYGIPDNKIGMVASMHTSGDGVLSVGVSVEPFVVPNFATGAVYVAPATNVYGKTALGQRRVSYPLPQLNGEFFETRLTLYQASGSGAPIVARWMLESIPGVTAGIEISAVITLFRTTEDKGILAPFNPYEEYLFLENLRRTQTPVAYVEGPLVAPVVTVDSIDWLPHSEEDAKPERGFRADAVVYLKTWAPIYLENLPTAVSDVG